MICALAAASLGQWVLGFLSLLLLPVIGVLSLTKRKLSPALVALAAVWLALGALALIAGVPQWVVGPAGQPQFWARWSIGMFLLLAIVLVAKLRERKKYRRWIEFALALLALLTFARGLFVFLEQFAG